MVLVQLILFVKLQNACKNIMNNIIFVYMEKEIILYQQ